MKATFEAMSRRTFEYLVLMPDGTEMEIEMQALTAADMLEIERAYPLPTAPQSKSDPFQKIGDSVYKQYDTRDPVYVEQVQAVHRLRTLAQIVRAWVADIPGDTEAEKIAALEGLPSAALNALVRCINDSATAGDVKPRPFRDNGKPEE